MPIVGGQGAWNSGAHLTLLQSGGQIMPTTLLRAHPDLKTTYVISKIIRYYLGLYGPVFFYKKQKYCSQMTNSYLVGSMNDIFLPKICQSTIRYEDRTLVNEKMTNRKLNGRYTWTVSLQMNLLLSVSKQ